MENTTTIPELDSIPSIDGNELLMARDGNSDKNLDISSLAQFVLAQLEPNTVSSLIQAATNNDLDAETLAGQLPNFYRNAGNLNAGKIPEARLPSGSWDGGFSLSSIGNGSVQTFRWIVPSFITAGIITQGKSVVIQGGNTTFIESNRTQTIPYPIPYTSGPSNGAGSLPIVYVCPVCRSSQFNTGEITREPQWRVEVDVRAHDVSLNNFQVSTIRTSGNDSGSVKDRVSANWFSIGLV